MNTGIIESHFDVSHVSPERRLLAWRDRVGHVIDAIPSRADLEKPFEGAIDRYQVGDLAMTNCRTTDLLLSRSIARVSTDRFRGFAFHIFLFGQTSQLSVNNLPRGDDVGAAPVLVLDLDQPVHMHRSKCRVLTFFAGRAAIEKMFPYPEALHGRTLKNTSLLTALIVSHARSLDASLPTLTEAALRAGILQVIELIIAAVSKQAQLTGNARAAARAAMYGQVKAYIHANIDRADLSPETILAALAPPGSADTTLSRPTLYRLFQHEGGLAAYIRHLRLRLAANELLLRPHAAIVEIAYGLGFNSPSDFSRAFRRAYGMTPQDLRASQPMVRRSDAPASNNRPR